MNNSDTEKKPVRIRKHKVLGNPFLGAVLLIIHGFFFYQTLSVFGGKSEAMTCVFGIIGALLLMPIHKFWFRPEFRGFFAAPFLKNRRILIAIAIFFAVDIAVGIPAYMEYGFAGPSILGTLTALMAGMAEETVFRGLPVSVMMRTYKDRSSYLPALILPAVIFGAMHMLNAFTGASLFYVAFEAAGTAVSGLFFGALYLRTGSIVPPMFVHVVHDLFCSFQANQTTGVSDALQTVSASDIITEIIMMAVQIALVIWLLRGEKEKISEIWNGLWNVPENGQKV